MEHRTDQERGKQLAALVVAHTSTVQTVISRALRPEDRHLVEDLAQDVWLTAWQYLLRGNTITRPAGLLATMARHRVTDHYRSARVRREVSTDPTAYGPLATAAAGARELVAA
ncbi:RNA polymerase sigma factor [Streptomyces hygroscopicus]|uniref:RNA polymerase sigma factor n=1 Tax=Streptomyces hygroscopicus TaxID=1912 RepID=UPI0036280D1C